MSKIIAKRNTFARDVDGNRIDVVAKKTYAVGKDICEEDARALLRMGKAVPAEAQTRDADKKDGAK